ncbi:hypothetical protein KR074_006526 [Drosophila pseudoananassae]|nr:hypothetical protein KR074_006526 [Drosophila pseudoananassae]
MSGSNHQQQHHRQIGFYEYLMPGIYDYPVTHSAAATMTAYTLQPILGLRLPAWTIPAQNPATYVAGPFGVINYVSDMESHMALPTVHTLVSGIIYEGISANPEAFYPHQMLCDFGQIETENREHYGYMGYGEAAINLCFSQGQQVSEEDQDRLETTRDAQRDGDVVEELVGIEPVAVEETGDVRRSSKRGRQENARGSGNGGEGHRSRRKQKSNRKRVYEAEQGYLVEEPTSDTSEEEDSREPPQDSPMENPEM